MFAPVFILLYVAHLLADYPLQTDHQADHKAEQSAAGWRANLAHAAIHVAVSALLLGLGALLLNLSVAPVPAAAGLLWIGASHSLIDRRRGVQWWMKNTGQPEFLKHGGAAHVDQTAHIAALTVAALAITTTA
ncbi:hypothetical protein CA983_02615 [Streptomyces swartbergensis]|uniref:DUF3307 domain-containing protein n=1 Tax=Streptomyces swartbergensis TaxID=487165 RepID=A0A243SAH5_9ACTN|nr:DUF3307 domain-containing protein [Streptomyces swartbergensis]OUD04734.1 hypothetical protein CA983_02615 [Streptomyces swartbergensis]